jgi:pimeloyl-ACP methyl ester carboxylesterase
MRPSPRSAAPLLTAIAAACGLASPRALAEESTELRLLGLARTVVAEASDHSLRPWVRERLWNDEAEARYGLQLDRDWQAVSAAAPERPLVVLIHGFNSTAARNAAVLAPIRAAGYPVGVFAYPNDSSIVESAERLSSTLKQFAAQNPGVSVALLTHSMGGIVARASVEDPQLDPGNVTRLVMIAPPNQGSTLAHASFGTDLWEHWLARSDGNVWRRWRDSVVDGLGEASDELVPGSPLLARLNARPRNARVRYAIFLGTHGAMSEREFGAMRWTLGKGLKVEHLDRLVQPVDNLVADMDEIVVGKGDGVVSVERGRLDGVDDVVLLGFDHFNCTDEPGRGDDDPVRQLQSELLARLK